MSNKQLMQALRSDPTGFILEKVSENLPDVSKIEASGHLVSFVESLNSPAVAAAHILSMSSPAKGEYCLRLASLNPNDRLPRGAFKRGMKPFAYVKGEDKFAFVTYK